MNLQEFRLANGLPVALLSAPEVKAVHLLVDIYSGSRNDRAGLHGEHHAFEHMPFRGTRRFPNNSAWSQPLERHGISASDATTGMSRTRFRLHMPYDRFRLGAEHLSELVFQPLLRPEDWELERPVILKEWQQAQNNAGRVSGSVVLREMFPNSPNLYLQVVGTPETIKAITTDHLRHILAESYNVNNVQLVVVGRVDELTLIDLASTFGHLQLSTGTCHRVEHVAEQQPGRRLIQQHPLFAEPQFQLFGSCTNPGWLARRHLSMFLDMLGGRDMGSPLFVELREKRSLVYSFALGIEQLVPGIMSLGFKTNVALDKADEVERVFWQCVQRCFEDRERFDFVRDRSLGKLLMRVFNPGDEAGYIAECFLNGDPYLSDDQFEELLRTVTFEEVVDVARLYMQPERFSRLIMHAE